MKDKIRGLYTIIDTTFSPQYSNLELAEMFLLGGSKLLQLRMKSENVVRGSFWSDEVFKVAKDIMRLKREFDFTFIINDYVDVAGEVAADGVHVGRDDMSIPDIRKRLKRDVIVGYSSHSLDEALRASRAGADYVALGAIFPSMTKGPGHPVQGIDNLRLVVRSVDKPVVAIGGINRENVREVLKTGVAAIAMITALTRAPDVIEETRWYVNLLGC